MNFKVFTFPFVFILCLDYCRTKPTFGDEFVHIKVHLPKEGGGDIHVHHPPHHHHPPIHAHAPPPSHHNVVHHFHHKRRRPAKKASPFGKHTGLLESIILSEVKKPLSSDHYKYLNHAEDIAKHVDTFVVKPEKPKPQIETYQLIEESPKPKETIETFKVIESKVPSQHHSPSHHYDFDEHEIGSSFDDGGYNYKPHKKVETFKVIDSLLDDYHTHVPDASPHYLPPSKKQRVKTVKIIDEPIGGGGGYGGGAHGSYDIGSQEYGTTNDDSYHYATKPHAESVKIIESKSPHQHSQEYSINFNKRPHSETVEIVKTNKPAKSSSYHNRHHHQQHQHQHFDDASQGYRYQRPSNFAVGGDDEDEGYDYKPPKYTDTYRTIPDEHYTQTPDDSYLPPKRPSSSHHNHHHHHHEAPQPHYPSNVRQNSLYDAEPVSISNTHDSYLPPQPPALSSLDGGSSAVSDGTHWAQPDTGYKATETYTGIDSYSADHVQGIGSGGYQYPSPYP